jgi:hypothetical protein
MHAAVSGILSLAQLSGSSDQMRLRNGAARPPPHEAEPVAPPSRPKRLNLTMLGLQLQVDVAIAPAGDLWAANNWQYPPAALGKVDEAL